MIPTKPPPHDKHAMEMTGAEYRAARTALRQREVAEPIRRADAAALARLEADGAARIASGQDESGVRNALIAKGMDEGEAVKLAAEIAARAKGKSR